VHRGAEKFPGSSGDNMASRLARGRRHWYGISRTSTKFITAFSRSEIKIMSGPSRPVWTLISAGQWGLLALFLCLWGGSAVLAAPAVLPELRTAAEIRRLSTQQADLRYPVRLRGVVTFFDDKIATKAFRFIQDETAGIYFYVDNPTNSPTLHAGQLVEIEGITGSGSFAPVVTSHHITILGEAPLPAAKPVTLGELTSGQEDSQFVEIRGLVQAVRFDKQTSYYTIDLITENELLTIAAARLPVAEGEQLVDSTVRVKGVCMSRFNSRRQLFDFGLLVPLPEDLVVERPAPEDPRTMPTQPIKNLLQYSWGGDIYRHRVKVAGTVTLRYSDKMYIQDDTDGLCVETRQTDLVPIGDRVEVIGFPSNGKYAPMLQNGTYRWLAEGRLFKPDIVTPDQALTGSNDCRVVQIQATLLDKAQHSKEPFLVLQADGIVFHAYMKGLGQTLEMGRLENGSKVAVTGVCVIDDLGEDWHFGTDWRAASFRLLMRFPGDVVVLEQPPWWSLTKLLWATGILCAVSLTAAGWVVLLRRRVDQQTKIIEEKLQAEGALKERYLDLFENASDMLFTHDLNGRMTAINKAGERLLQHPRDKVLSLSLVDLIAEDQRPAAREWIKQVTSGEDVSAVDWEFLNAAGQKLKLEVSSRLVEQAGRSIEVEGVARDVTARKRMEREILEISNREQQRLGHDLHDGVCQQLAAIAYRAHILARHLSEKSAAESSEAGDISHLINESLVQTRTVARGLFPVRLEEDGLLAAVEELSLGAGRLYNVKCSFTSAENLPALHNGVAMHLHFIAQEAILNAAKHSRAKAIAVRLLRDNGDLILTVKDDGVGFQLTDHDRGGMGIGIMRYRARAIGAVLELQSQPGKGTQIVCKYHLQPDEILHNT
jgi:PAS domain S-box-containing protein